MLFRLKPLTIDASRASPQPPSRLTQIESLSATHGGRVSKQLHAKFMYSVDSRRKGINNWKNMDPYRNGSQRETAPKRDGAAETESIQALFLLWGIRSLVMARICVNNDSRSTSIRFYWKENPYNIVWIPAVWHSHVYHHSISNSQTMVLQYVPWNRWNHGLPHISHAWWARQFLES